jgi:predicted NBD/HSP70 family sugar kinase
MRRVGIRDLSADVIRDSASHSQVLGITRTGSLVGVLVPINHDLLQRLAARDAEELLAKAAEVYDQSEAEATDLRDMLLDGTEPTGRPVGFARVGIRDISGARLAEASAAGESFVVTSDRVAVAIFIPVAGGWVDRLIEDSVARLFADQPRTEPAPGAAAKSRATTHAEAAGIAGPRVANQRAIGIRIVGDARHDRKRLVGVVTDGFARIKVDHITLPLERLDETYVFDQLLSLIETLRARLSDADELIGVGIEIGGHVHQGRVVRSANIHWDQFPLADELHDFVRVPVVLENDANALAINEHLQGISATNFAVVLLTHLGVGCGLIVDGRLHRGAHGMAAEVGHIPIGGSASADRWCRCGNADCLENVATPKAIEADLRESGFAGSYEQAIQATQDPLVRDVFARAGTALGSGVATVLNLVDPEAVVVYGPLDIVGPPREFHIGNFDAVADAEAAPGVWRLYTGGMVDSIRRHVFSNAAKDCQFVVRVGSDDQGAQAAAAAVIRAIRDGSVAPRHRSSTYVERSR